MLLDEFPGVTFIEIKGTQDYLIGNNGVLLSRHRSTRGAVKHGEWHVVTGGVDRDGYRKAIICSRGKRKYVRIHVLVLEAFCGEKPGRECVAAHNDGNKTNNSISNLRWATQAENVEDKRAHGTWQCGEKSGLHKLTVDEVLSIRDRRSSGEKLKDIAAVFGVSVSTVQAIATRRLWKHLA